MACGRAPLNQQDGTSIGKVLSVLVHNVSSRQNGYDITKPHKEILLDFDDAEANVFLQSLDNPLVICFMDAQSILLNLH